MGGQTVAGVLRPVSCGEPAGTMRITETKRSYGQQQAVAATSEDAINHQEIGAQFQYLQSLTAVQTQDWGCLN